MPPILARIRERFAPLLLLAAAGAAAVAYMPPLPKDRKVQVRLPDSASVTAVDIAWAPVAHPEEAVSGTAWHFAAGRAPAALDADVRLPDGRYDVDVRVEHGAESEAFHRVITLGDGERITVRLR
jgi:hypothetical protein